MSTTPVPTHRIEWCGNIKVYVPDRPPWWAPHASKECSAFTRPHADCDCGEGLIA